MGQAKERDILALAEGARAVLIGRGWEAPGYWVWERTSRGRMVRAYYDTTDPRRTVRVPSRDAPTHFRPHAEIARSRAAEQRPSLEQALTLPEPIDAYERRLMQAFRVDDAMPDREREMLRVRILWPATSCGPGDYPPSISTQFRPSREQIDDWLQVMAGLRGLPLAGPELLVLRLHARGYQFRSIAEHPGVARNEQRTRALYKRTVAMCWRASLQNSRRQGARAHQRP